MWLIEIEGKKLWAWSTMECKNSNIHEPHTWNAEYLRYGPYACPGVKDPDEARGLI